MIEYQYTVTDPSGLHARPATLIAACCMNHKSSVHMVNERLFIDAGDVLAVMGLYAKHGQKIMFYIDGEDEEETLADLKSTLERL